LGSAITCGWSGRESPNADRDRYTAAAGVRSPTRVAWGDCPAGCIYEHFWVFRVEGASVELLEDYGDQVAVRETSWGEIKARFLGSK
jgi:hypothetical protein